MPQCRECHRNLQPIDAWCCGQCDGALCSTCVTAHLSRCNVQELSTHEEFRRASRRHRLLLWLESWKLNITEWWHGWRK